MSAASPIEFFYLFLDDEFWNLVVTLTNLHAEQFSCTTISRNSRFVGRKPVDTKTIKKYFGLCLLMGLVSKPKFTVIGKPVVLLKHRNLEKSWQEINSSQYEHLFTLLITQRRKKMKMDITDS